MLFSPGFDPFMKNAIDMHANYPLDRTILALKSKVKDQWEALKGISSDINYFICRLETTANNGIGIFGGAVRDWYLDKTPKDIDIVVDTFYFKEILEGVKIAENTFGGTVIILDGITFDIWNLPDTYAFKSGQFSASWENLIYSVPFNLDAIIVMTDGRVYDHPAFWNGLNNKEIDFMNSVHKDPKFLAQRAVLFAKKYKFALSLKLTDYIRKHLNSTEILDIENLSHAPKKSSNREMSSDDKLMLMSLI